MLLTIKSVILDLKLQYPQNALTENALRRLVKQGQIPSVAIGRVRLVTKDNVVNYISNPPIESPSTQYNQIRQVKM